MALSLPRLTRGSAPVPRPKNFEKNNGNPPARGQAKPAGQSGNRRLPSCRYPPASEFYIFPSRLPPGESKRGLAPPFHLFFFFISAGGVGGGRERPDKGTRGSAPVPRLKNFEKNNKIDRPGEKEETFLSPAGEAKNFIWQRHCNCRKAVVKYRLNGVAWP